MKSKARNVLVGACTVLASCASVPTLYDPPLPKAVAVPGSGKNLRDNVYSFSYCAPAKVDQSGNKVVACTADAPVAPDPEKPGSDAKSDAAKPDPAKSESDATPGSAVTLAPTSKPEDFNSEHPLSPKVRDVLKEITCELARAGLADNLLITVQLTLELDDNLDLTPSITFTETFAGSGRNRTVLASADLGGGRKRTFTANLYLDSAKLTGQACENELAPGFKPGAQRFYTLRGDLKLKDIVRDGQAAIAYQLAVQSKPSEKTIPTFGSSTTFIVTKNLTALGPQWTLSNEKYPGGSTGLFNGKRLRTDTLTITFALVPPTAAPAPLTKDTLAIIEAIKQSGARGVAKEQQASAAAANTAKALAAQASFAAKNRISLMTLPLNPALQQQFAKLDAAVRAAKAQQDKIAADQAAEARALEGLKSALTAAQAAPADETSARAAAAQAGQSLLTTMILQNLSSTLPR